VPSVRAWDAGTSCCSADSSLPSFRCCSGDSAAGCTGSTVYSAGGAGTAGKRPDYDALQQVLLATAAHGSLGYVRIRSPQTECSACNTLTPVMQQRTLHVASRVAHGKRADSADRSLPMSYHTATHARSQRSQRSLTRAINSSPDSGRSCCLPAQTCGAVRAAPCGAVRLKPARPIRMGCPLRGAACRGDTALAQVQGMSFLAAMLMVYFGKVRLSH
jgi:hypothetical protein